MFLCYFSVLNVSRVPLFFLHLFTYVRLPYFQLAHYFIFLKFTLSSFYIVLKHFYFCFLFYSLVSLSYNFSSFSFSKSWTELVQKGHFMNFRMLKSLRHFLRNFISFFSSSTKIGDLKFISEWPAKSLHRRSDDVLERKFSKRNFRRKETFQVSINLNVNNNICSK